jgi:hypothetical protein
MQSLPQLTLTKGTGNASGQSQATLDPPATWELHMRLHFATVLFTLVCTPVLAQRGPEEVVQGFYTSRLANQSSGAPSGRELADFSAYLGPELVCVLGAALRYNESFAQAHPNDKPPFAEGDLYSSSIETPTRFTLGKLQSGKTGASIPVHFYRDEEGKPDTKGWQDVVHLKISRTRWTISDVEYQGGFALGNKGSLFDNLRETLESSKAVAGWSARELDSCTMDKVAPAKAKAKGKGKNKGKSASKSKGKASPSKAKKKGKH